MANRRDKEVRPSFAEFARDLLDEPIEIPEIELFNEEAIAGAAYDPSHLTDSEADEFREIMCELSRRENESLRLYEPMPIQEEFHSSYAEERLLLGGNRGGKTLPACVELARAITGQDPHEKFDKQDGRAVVVGRDLKHCSKVIYRKLFKPGAFKVIYDPFLCRIRAYRPHLEWDLENADNAKYAPPLIPGRFYSQNSISWDNKREEIPKTIILSTGWETSFFSSDGTIPQGWDINLGMFDEEIEREAWYGEISARLLDRRLTTKDKRRFLNGRFWWSATPQAGTQHLYDLYERAEECKEDAEPVITKHEVSLLENVHINQKAKDSFISKIAADEDEYLVRVKGQFAILGSKIYSEFMPRGVHGCKSFSIPYDWTRYMALDPGRQVCAALFIAIPPPGLEKVVLEDGEEIPMRNRKVIYDEMYIRRCSAAIFGEALKRKLGDQTIFSWWIDYRAGRIHEMGAGLTVEQQFAKEMKAQRISCTSHGYRFLWASDDVKGGIMAVRNGFHIRENGHSEWLVQWERVPCFIDEAKKYSYKKLPGTKIVTDEPLQRNNHLMDCFRYLALAPLRYHRPEPRKRKEGYTLEILARKKKKQRKEEGGACVKLY